VEDIKTGQQYT